MILKDADALITNLEKSRELNESMFSYDNEKMRFIDYGLMFAKQKVETAPAVDAIPVEQVARMLDKASHCPPCIALSMPGIDDIDKWCDENCRLYIDTDKRDCWEHAIREGWLEL